MACGVKSEGNVGGFVYGYKGKWFDKGSDRRGSALND